MRRLFLYSRVVLFFFKAKFAAFVTDVFIGSANILRKSAGLAARVGGFALTVVLGATFVDEGYCSASLNRFSENCWLSFVSSPIGICL